MPTVRSKRIIELCFALTEKFEAVLLFAESGGITAVIYCYTHFTFFCNFKIDPYVLAPILELFNPKAMLSWYYYFLLKII